MNKNYLFFVIFLALISAGLLFRQKQNSPKKEIHYHAGFQLYTDGKLRDFSTIKYMSVKACDDKNEESEENEQIEKAHLHDKIGDVVHVEAENAKWKDLFVNLNYQFDGNKEFTGYINGNKINDILSVSIKEYDSIVIFEGKADEKLLKNAVSKEKIRQAEKKSESC